MRRATMMPLGIWAAFVTLAACGGGTAAPPPEYPPVQPDETATTPPPPDPAATATETPAQPATPPPPPVQVVAAERTPIEGTGPTLRILRPHDKQTIHHGNVMVRVRLKHWELAAAPGKHVHLILDNEPYIAIRDVSHPLNLNELVQQHLHHDLAPGTHVLRMFPSRAQHESVKAGSPFGVVVFNYQHKTEGFTFDPHAPLLTYSRPKGCNKAGQRVLLDFYLANVDHLAADGTRVHYSIDGSTTGDITQWAPHYIENLPVGQHTIELSLIGADGQPIAGPFNDTTRTITVAQTCQAAAPAAPAPAGGSGGPGASASAPGHAHGAAAHAAPGHAATPAAQAAPGHAAHPHHGHDADDAAHHAHAGGAHAGGGHAGGGHAGH